MVYHLNVLHRIGCPECFQWLLFQPESSVSLGNKLYTQGWKYEFKSNQVHIDFLKWKMKNYFNLNRNIEIYSLANIIFSGVIALFDAGVISSGFFFETLQNSTYTDTDEKWIRICRIIAEGIYDWVMMRVQLINHTFNIPYPSSSLTMPDYAFKQSWQIYYCKDKNINTKFRWFISFDQSIIV